MTTQHFSDPFADLGSGQTFIKPSPRGREAVASLQSGLDVAIDLATSRSGINPLVALANPLLALVPQIRATVQLADPTALRDSIAHGIREFEAAARAQAMPPERVMAARYILCTLLDEVAASMPWGEGGQWGRHSLLAIFHNETGGGERVFQLMAKLAENVRAHRELLELIYAALCLGFEGRYRVVQGGRAQIESVRERLAQILQRERGAYSPALAQNWQGQAATGGAMLSWLPLWVTAAVVALMLAGLYSVLALRLAQDSDPVFDRIQALRLDPPVPPVKLRAPKPRVAQFLVSEIEAGLVAVSDEVDRSVVTLHGDGLFAPASASVGEERRASIARVAQALREMPGTVLVTGHTDNARIRTAGVPSNWHLSHARAKAVQGLLVAGGVQPSRLRAEGRAEAEPIASNDTPAGRAMNRRVEITLVAR